MAKEIIEVVLKVLEPVWSFVFGSVSDYVGYIGSYEDNLQSLRNILCDLCNTKDDIKSEVKEGKNRQEEITKVAANWLLDVHNLTEDEALKELMYTDIDTAKFVVKLMGKKDLKRRLNKESEMQVVAVKVMKKLKEEMETYEEDVMTRMREADYKKVAEVVVEVMKDTLEEFKKLMKEDKKMAVIATKTLKANDLDKLTKDDMEMEEIVKEALNASDEELWRNHEDEESNALLLKSPMVDVDVNKNRVKEAAKKLFTPLENLLTPIKNLFDDAEFKKAVPEAGGIKLGLEVVDALFIKSRWVKKETDDNAKHRHKCCCCSSFSICDYHRRYQISKAAKMMTEQIQDEFIKGIPKHPFTLPMRLKDFKSIPTEFSNGLESRDKLLDQIVEKLNDDQVDAVGVYGMGGAGKTTLAKEVMKRVKDTFSKKSAMVEVSDVVDIVRIQEAIAESIGLPLHDVDSVGQRAIKLYNILSSDNKEKKVVIILDNVWKRLNLSEIGIPSSCKIFLTTRDKEVCRVMDVKDVNMLEVGLLNTNEAIELFKCESRNQINVDNKSLVERLLSKCGGLPLAIVAVANALKDRDLSSWEKFAKDIEKPIAIHSTVGGGHIYPILLKSFKFIEVEEKKIFFLLVCLSPIGSSVSIDKLLRYGIGLDLFQNVNKLCEAIECVEKWASELVLSSMLLKGDVKGEVKIHDIVRAFAVSVAAKEEGHKFIVESIPRWMNTKSLKEYTAMSLMSTNDWSRLSGVDACRLRILILKGDMSFKFDNLFFEGMVNLEVLDLSNMNLFPCLPKSMGELLKLQTLCMENCKLGDLQEVCRLGSLLVLSFRGSFFKELPRKINELSKLLVLDLSGCTCNSVALIPTGILNRLSKLEGLYLYNNMQKVFDMELLDDGTSVEKEIVETGATTIGNCKLPHLNTFEIKVKELTDLPVDGQSFENVEKFKVCIGYTEIDKKLLSRFSRVLFLEGCEPSVILENYCLNKAMLKRADYLSIKNIDNLEPLVELLDQEGFRELHYLSIKFCNQIKYIVKGGTISKLISFPRLESLKLYALDNLEMVCDGEISRESFSNLRDLTFTGLDKITYGLLLVPRHLNQIVVVSCYLMKFVFIEDEETRVIDFPFLKKLNLREVDSLVGLVGQQNLYSLQENPIFFHPKIGFPSLEQLDLQYCKSIVKLWSNPINTSGFQNLKNVYIYDCGNLSSVGPSSLLSVLVQLEILEIYFCEKMDEIITLEDTEESESSEQVLKFPQLKYLKLEGLVALECFHKGGSKLEFPKLKTLELNHLNIMKSFANFGMSSVLFHNKIDFPCLEELNVTYLSDDVVGLWDSQSLNTAPKLRKLIVGQATGLRQIPYVVLQNLSSIKLFDLEKEVVFASSDVEAEEGIVWIYSQLPNLEELIIDGGSVVKDIFKMEDYNDSKALDFCERLKTLELSYLLSENITPLHLFKGLASLKLNELKWEYLISADMLQNSLQQLQYLSIVLCRKMKALVTDVVSDIKLPRLKHLELDYLDSMVSFSTTSEGEGEGKGETTLHLPSLESLKIHSCPKLVHFWSGSIIAPKLQDLKLSSAFELQQFLIGNPEQTIELPSLRQVVIQSCYRLKSLSLGNANQKGDLQLPYLEVVYIAETPNLDSFSLVPIKAPKLTHVLHNRKEHLMLVYDDLNHFLKKVTAKTELGE